MVGLTPLSDFFGGELAREVVEGLFYLKIHSLQASLSLSLSLSFFFSLSRYFFFLAPLAY